MKKLKRILVLDLHKPLPWALSSVIKDLHKKLILKLICIDLLYCDAGRMVKIMQFLGVELVIEALSKEEDLQCQLFS